MTQEAPQSKPLTDEQIIVIYVVAPPDIQWKPLKPPRHSGAWRAGHKSFKYWLYVLRRKLKITQEKNT